MTVTWEWIGVDAYNRDDLLGAGRFECPVCGDRFETVGDKRRHLREKHSPDH